MISVERADASARAVAVAWSRAAGVVGAVAGLDQLTKHAIADGIAYGSDRSVVPGLKLVHVLNPGVAFGFLSGGGAIVLVFTVVALIVLSGYLTLRPGRRLLWLPTGMLIGGALGNLIDRIANGSVTDFIKLPHWPAFNVADMSITFGVLVLLWVLEGPRRRDG
jgi:signal peptidase II